MQISNCPQTIQKSPSFGAAPTTKALHETDKLCREAELLLHPNGSKTTFDIPQYSLYGNEQYDTGIGKIGSKEALYLAKTMKPYIGFDDEKIYPIGRFVSQGCAEIGFFCPYERGGYTIGEDNIDWLQLTEENYGKILSKQDVQKFANSNKASQTSIDDINYENELGSHCEHPFMELSKKAYKNLNKLPKNHPLRQEFEIYKKSPVISDFYDRLALWKPLHEKEPDLFLNFDKDSNKQKRFAKYKKQYKKDIDLFKFNQFIAFKQMKDAKAKYNAQGIELTGDVAIGFNEEDYWAFRDAFHEDKSIGFEFPMHRFEDILEDENSFAAKILKTKIAFACEIYDGLRLDVGTSYQKRDYYGLKDKQMDYSEQHHYDLEDKVLLMIEKIYKDTKGENADLSKITYEGDGTQYAIFRYPDNKAEVNPYFAKRNLVLSTQYEYDMEDILNNHYTGDSVDFYLNKAHLDGNYATIGTNNHDGATLKKVSLSDENKEWEESCNYKQSAIPVLSEALGLNSNSLKNPKNWVKAKFAEIYLAPKRFFHIPDIMGDTREVGNCRHGIGKEGFRYRVTPDFEEKYNTALQNGDGFNRPEAISMALKAKGLDKTNPILFEKLDYLGKYLRQKGALSTKQADIEAKNQGTDKIMEHLNSIG